MKLQVLISTMHKIDHTLIEKMNIHCDAIVVNQCDRNSAEEIQSKDFQVKWINSTQRGLSRSRNLAMKNITADVCLLSDDDMVYVNGYEKLVLNEFKKYPEADIITFQVEGIEGTFKEYYHKARKLNYLSLMKVASVEIAFRTDSIKNSGISFEELFGAGAKYFMGEESIFLFDCINKSLKIVYVPIKIANLHMGESTWFKGYNKEYFISKGAAFTRMWKLLSVPLILQFAIRKYKLFKGEVSLWKAISYMLQGRSRYIYDLKGCEK